MSWREVSDEMKGGLFMGMIVGVFIGYLWCLWVEDSKYERVREYASDCVWNDPSFDYVLPGDRDDSLKSSLSDCLYNALSSR